MSRRMAAMFCCNDATSISTFSSRLAIFSSSASRCLRSCSRRCIVCCDDSSCRCLNVASSRISRSRCCEGIECCCSKPWEMCSSSATTVSAVERWSAAVDSRASSNAREKAVISSSRCRSFSYLSLSPPDSPLRSASSSPSSESCCCAARICSFKSLPTESHCFSSLDCASTRSLRRCCASRTSGSSQMASSSSSCRASLWSLARRFAKAPYSSACDCRAPVAPSRACTSFMSASADCSRPSCRCIKSCDSPSRAL
mmetsp:Transcript_15380/g.51807  ORF Transcript_15380/g.51807 Transcript_15380/m.51807 type:complete len:256 (-) Transcript_15380:712-1479(-)